MVRAAAHRPAAVAATHAGAARRIGYAAIFDAIIAAFATVAGVTIEVAAGAVAAGPSIAAGIAAGPAMAAVAVEVDAFARTARFSCGAGMATVATVVPVEFQAGEAFAIAAAARSTADRRIVEVLGADARAQVAARPAVVGVGVQVVDTDFVTAGLARETADIAANLVAGRAGSADSFQTDLIRGAGGGTGRAMIPIGIQIDTVATAAALASAADRRAGAAVRLVRVEVVASGATLGEAVLARALVVLALHPGATVVVPVTRPAEVLAGQRLLGPAGQQCAQHAAEERFHGAAA